MDPRKCGRERRKARDDWRRSKREDKVRFLDALDFDVVIARFGGSRGDPFANQKNIISKGFVHRTLRERRVRERRERKEREERDKREKRETERKEKIREKQGCEEKRTEAKRRNEKSRERDETDD